LRSVRHSRAGSVRLVGSLLVAFGLQACGQKDAGEELSAAKAAIAKDDGKTATIHLKNALEQDPQRGEARLLLGKVLLESGNAAGAEVEFSKAKSLNVAPEQLAALHVKSMVAQRESRKALEQYGTLQLADAPAAAELKLALATAQASLGKREAARALIDEALKLQPQSVNARLASARSLLAEGQIDAGVALVDTLLKENGKLAEAWRIKGDVANFKRDAAGARKAYEAAVDADPRSLGAQGALMTTLMLARDMDAARKRLDVLRKQPGATGEVLYFSAAIALEARELQAAFDHIQQLLKVAPDDPRALMLAAHIEFQRGNFLPAEAHLNRVLGRGVDTPAVRGLLAHTYLRRDEPRAALEALAGLPDSATADARVHALAGEALMRMGEVKKAEVHFRKAVELNPQDSRSRILLAMREANSGSTEKGIGQLQDIATEFDNPAANVAIVATLVRKGDYAGALKAIDQAAAKLQPGGADSMRASIFLMQGDRDKARSHWETSLKQNPKFLPAALQLARLDQAAGKPQDAVARLEGVLKADPTNVDVKLAALAARDVAQEGSDSLVALAKRIAKEHPKSPAAQLAWIRVVGQRQDLTAALQAAQDASAELPADPQVLEQLGLVQLRLREHKLAAHTFKKLVELKPNSAAALMRLVEVEIAQRDFAAALATAKRAQAAQPGRLDTQRALVALESELGNVAGARRLLKEIQAQPGREAFAFALEGDLESSQRNWDAARAAYRRALERGGQAGEVAGKLHGSLVAGGKEADAQSFEKQWLADHPEDWAFRTYLGNLALARSAFDAARTHYESVLKGQSGNAVVRNNLAWVLLQTGNLAEAETHVAQALTQRPGDAEVLDTQALLLSRQGKHEQALQVQRRVVGVEPGNPARRVALAKLMVAAKQNEQARAELQAVLKLGEQYPGQAEVRQLLQGL
jgi:putative PEP-CTERM system TPR-repeat lipoprotein